MSTWQSSPRSQLMVSTAADPRVSHCPLTPSRAATFLPTSINLMQIFFFCCRIFKKDSQDLLAILLCKVQCSCSSNSRASSCYYHNFVLQVWVNCTRHVCLCLCDSNYLKSSTTTLVQNSLLYCIQRIINWSMYLKLNKCEWHTLHISYLGRL